MSGKIKRKSPYFHGTNHLSYDDISHVLQNELSLSIERQGDSKVAITLTLRDKPIGKPITVKASLTWYHDTGGGDTYVDGIQLDIA